MVLKQSVAWQRQNVIGPNWSRIGNFCLLVFQQLFCTSRDIRLVDAQKSGDHQYDKTIRKAVIYQ